MGLINGWKSGALVKYQAGHVMKNPCFFAYAKNKDADQPANPCSLIIVFVNRCLDRTIYIRNFKPLARILSGANQFEFYLTEKSEGRFSRYEAQMKKISNALGRSRHEKSLVFAYAKNKDADQPANPCSLIIVFVNRCLDRTIYIRNSKPLARILSGANQFQFYLTEKSEGRFSRYEAQMIKYRTRWAGHVMKNPWFLHMQKTKTQTGLRIRAV